MSDISLIIMSDISLVIMSEIIEMIMSDNRDDNVSISPTHYHQYHPLIIINITHSLSYISLTHYHKMMMSHISLMIMSERIEMILMETK